MPLPLRDPCISTTLVAALGSYLDARAAGGEWLVRMEDPDHPREVPGVAAALLRTLEAFGFEWDGRVLRQSARTHAYAQAVERLRNAGLVSPCACSRREIAANGLPGVEGPVYPGTCRHRLPPGRRARSLRLRTEHGTILVRDRVQGMLRQDLACEVGDFVLRRADGIHAYQLAMVVDDGFQGINQIVRGADLLASTPRQVFLLRALRLPVPTYAHAPGDRRHRAQAQKSHAAAPLPTLLRAWRFLGQIPFPEPPADLAEFWARARSTWNMDRVPSRRSKALTAE